MTTTHRTDDSLPATTTPGLAPQPTAPAPAPRRRPTRLTVAVVLLALLGAVVVLRPLQDRREEAVTYLTEPATATTLTEQVQADAVVAFDEAAVRTVALPRAGTVTAVQLDEGAAPTPLAPAVEVDGRPIAWVPTDVPLHRDLAEGAEGPDVERLEAALHDAGHDPGEVDEVFDADTADAVRAWQADLEVEETGTVLLADVVSFPDGMVVVDLPLAVGTVTAQPGQPLATVADPDALHVAAAVEGADVAAVAVGDAVTVHLDGHDDPLEGEVRRLPMVAREDGAFPVEVVVADLPALARAGQEASVDITTATRPDVVTVPLAALQGSGNAVTVRVLVDGEPQDRSVTLGLVTAEGAEVTGGIAEGEQVVVGEQDDEEADR